MKSPYVSLSQAHHKQYPKQGSYIGHIARIVYRNKGNPAATVKALRGLSAGVTNKQFELQGIKLASQNMNHKGKFFVPSKPNHKGMDVRVGNKTINFKGTDNIDTLKREAKKHPDHLIGVRRAVYEKAIKEPELLGRVVSLDHLRSDNVYR
jgi:hypothetical protein